MSLMKDMALQIAVFVTTTQVTVITQFFYTINIGASTGVLVTTNFNLNGNVANSLPTVITGMLPQIL